MCAPSTAVLRSAAERDEALVEHVEEGAMAPALRDRLTADGLDEDAGATCGLIEAQRACTGAVPHGSATRGGDLPR